MIAELATDAPMMPHQLRCLAKRAGIGRGGTPGGNNSGDIFLAFSTANPRPLPQLAAEDAPIQRPRGGICKAICPDPLVELVTGQRRRQHSWQDSGGDRRRLQARGDGPTRRPRPI
ncbi:P1 family peptidase [Halomonas sp. H5]|uniref:P1 family peptidase n=1 Tax=Halomonas sp. H5 TaxID=3423910 RepID=UPI003D36C322